MNRNVNWRRLHHFPWYPLLIALIPVARFYEANFRSFYPGAFVRISIGFLMDVGCLYLLAGWFLKDRHRAALAVAPLAVFYAAGEAMGAGWAWTFFGLGVLLVASMRWRRPTVAMGTLPLNVVCLLLVVLPLANAWRIDRGLEPPVPTRLFLEPLELTVPAGAQKPDVWYLLLDGLGSPAYVEKEFQVSPGAYSGQLRRRGFEVPQEAFANYEQTGLSLSATWNVAHIPALLDVPDTTSHDRRVLYDLIDNSRVRRAFEDLGYRTVDVPSSYPMTRWHGVDATVKPFLSPTMVESAVIARGMMPLVQPVFGKGPAAFSFALRRRALNFQFEHLPDARARVPAEDPVLVFAHIMAPHPPFVFEADGSPRRSEKRFEYFDGSHWLDLHGWAAGNYPEKYRAQAIYTMDMLGKAIDRIIEQAERPTVIIVQGDHGPGSRLDWERPRHSDHNERFSIFNGWYLPEGYRIEIPERMTAIQTFPVLLRLLFGAEVERPADVNLISRWSRPYVFYEVKP